MKLWRLVGSRQEKKNIQEIPEYNLKVTITDYHHELGTGQGDKQGEDWSRRGVKEEIQIIARSRETFNRDSNKS